MNMEQNEKMGRLICEMRKMQKMTQKDLAQKLNVTDKAVSKWERGISCPDVALLMPLAKVLGLSTGELLNGEKDLTLATEKENIVEEALLYSERSNTSKLWKIRKAIMGVLFISIVLAAAICLICDFSLNKKLSWSLIVIEALVLSWVVILPFLHSKDKVIKRFLKSASIAIIPYLFILSILLNDWLIFKVGGIVSLISIAGVWCIYGIYVKMWNRKFRATGFTVLVCIPITIGTNAVAAYFTGTLSSLLWDSFIGILLCLLLSALFFGVDYYMEHNSKS